MALNPIAYTENILKSFLRYQLTAYPFADQHLHVQMRELLSLDKTRQSPLFKGPYISLSRPFRPGAAIDDLIGEGLLHPHLRERIPRGNHPSIQPPRGGDSLRRRRWSDADFHRHRLR